MAQAQLNVRARRDGAASISIALLAVLIAITSPVDAATTYKWVDKNGQVHLSDTPPQGVPYEVIVTPSHPAPASATPPPAPVTPIQEPLPTPKPAKTTNADSALEDARRDQACVDALYQVALLTEKRPVFKQAADGTRQYLDDAARPAELKRLEDIRDATCSEDAATRKAQERRADELMIALSPGCAEARDKLASYEDPATRTPDDVIARQRALVERDCRGGERMDLWRGDWIRIRIR